MPFFKLKARSAAELTIREQTMFFLPLAVTSLIMTFSHTLFNAGLARMPSPEVMIAAFAVAKSLMQIMQSPVAMVRQTVTALVTSRANFRRTFIFLAIIVSGVVFILAVTTFSGLSRILFRHLMGLSGQTLDQAVMMLRILFLFPMMVAMRDIMSGLALKFRIAPLITISSFIRIVYVLIFVFFIEEMSAVPGAYLAGIMFIGGVAIEALVLFIGTRISVGKISLALDSISETKNTQAISYSGIGRFYAPLVVTTLIATSVMPLINSGLARSTQPDFALSTFAVAWGLGMIVISPFMTFHQVTLNYYEQGNVHARSLQKFAVILALLSSSALALLGFTDLGYLILTRLIGASHEISLLSADVLKVMCLLPFLLVTREYYWGILMKRRQTKQIWQGKAVNLVALVIALPLLVLARPANPAIIGVLAIFCCDVAEVAYHVYKSRKNGFNTPA